MKKSMCLIVLALIFLMMFSACGSSDTNNDLKDNLVQSGSQSDQSVEQDSSNDDELQPETEVELIETEITMYAQTSVNIRSLPSTDGEKLGTLSTNQEVTVLGEAKDGWHKIRHDGEIAYVSAQYLGTEKVEVATYVPQKQVDEITAEDLPIPSDFDPNGIVVVIDAGHQGRWNSQKEPDGPSSSTLKTKVSSGATGCVTNQQEYDLNLKVSLKLRDELKARGYQVVMIRETNSINISNSERAKFANKLNADAFIRIHANSNDNSSVHGVETLCQTASNPYNANLYSDSRRLSECILDGFVESTGAKRRSVFETDTMSGINWCQVPVTILEMGFLSNPEEDRLMFSEEYQYKMVEGIANGLDRYFGR